MTLDIDAWLGQLGLAQYADLFRSNDIDRAVLGQLTGDDLKEMGIVSVGHRRKLLEALTAFAAPTGRAAAPSDISPVATALPSAERRQLTVMFVDLIGSTALSAQLDPEDMREVMADYHNTIAETVAGFDGFVAKYMGDGVLVYFGYPRAHEDDAERAVRSGLAAVAGVGRLNIRSLRLQIRVGIASGLVVVGDLIGAGSAQEQSVVGETPNLAARLQALAAPDSLVIADSTRRQIGRLFDLQDLGAPQLVGFAKPQRAWRVIGESGQISRFEAMHPEWTPIVGRDEEIELLIRSWHQARGGEGRVVLISGEPGIGKSRLTAALSEHIGAEPHTRLRYFCSPHHQHSALHPIIVQLGRAAGFSRDDTPVDKRNKLLALLDQGMHDGDSVALLSELLSLPSTAAELTLTPQRKREKLFEAVLAQLEAEARREPVLMVFEDAHWIDPTSRELLDLAVDRIRQLPVLMLITFRPEFQPPWGGVHHVTSLTLNRLKERDGKALVEGLAGAANISAEVIAEIVQRTDGVPLFLEELTKAALESVGPEGGVAALLSATPSAGQSVPATLQASLIARLDRLGPLAKEIGQVGAVLGRGFVYDLIAPVTRRPETELLAALGQLTDAGLLFCRGTPPNSSYLFKHALVQDAAYSTLLRARRRELHTRVAAVLEENFPALVERQPELLAHHLTGAADTERAIVQWHKAGQFAVARSANREAANHIGCALDLLSKLPPSKQRTERELELSLALAIPLIAAHGFGSLRVEEVALRAKDLSDQLQMSPRRFAAQRVAWNSCLLRQPVPSTVALARDLFASADRDQDPAKLAIAHRTLGYSLLIAGEFREGCEFLTRGAALADAVPDEEFAVYGEHPSMVCRMYSGKAHLLMGFAETGTRLVEAAVAHARREESPHSLAWALGVAAHVFQIGHEPIETAHFALEAMKVAWEHRLPQWLALGERCYGWAIYQLGDRKAGLRLQHKGVGRWYETGAKLHTTHCETGLAENYLDQDQVVPARRHLTNASAHCASHDERYLAAEVERLTALLMQREGAPLALVREHLSKALGIAYQQGARLLELRCATALARMLAKSGELREACNLLSPIYGSFTEGFNTTDLKQAKTQLTECGN